MTDYFAVQLPPEQIRSISSIGLAHIGDAVYELLVRTWLCAGGKATGKGLHRAAVALVCAPRQAELAEIILPLLTQEEQDVPPGPQRQRPFHPGPCQPGPVSAGHGPGGSAGLSVSPGAAGPGQPAVLPDDGGGVICRWTPFA